MNRYFLRYTLITTIALIATGVSGVYLIENVGDSNSFNVILAAVVLGLSCGCMFTWIYMEMRAIDSFRKSPHVLIVTPEMAKQNAELQIEYYRQEAIHYQGLAESYKKQLNLNPED